MKKVGIIGLGLIGGSIAKALKRRSGYEVVAMSRNEKSLKAAKDEGVISDYSTTDFSIFKDCDVVFVCVPVAQIAEYADKLAPHIKKTCIITDVGSTKSKIAETFAARDDVVFIGGHPMAGSEKAGYSAASEFLFENAFYILTPRADEKPENLNRMKNIIEAMGAIPVTLNADYHDKVMAAVSHGPHVIAAVLVNMIKNGDDKFGTMHTLCAGGFKDITRIASSDPTIWQQISIDNKAEILGFIHDFKDLLDSFAASLEEENPDRIFDFFDKTKSYRDSFAQSKSGFADIYEVYTDIIDKPGTIATVATALSANNINIKNIGIVNNREHQNGILHIILENGGDKTRTVELLKNMDFAVYG